jgi:hypothetical protein
MLTPSHTHYLVSMSSLIITILSGFIPPCLIYAAGIRRFVLENARKET